LAVDYTNDPYYGEIDVTNERLEGKPKKSTNSFYSYISLCIIKKNKRFTISVLPVEKGMNKTDYLDYFIKIINQIGLKINVLCLDREFYSRPKFDSFHYLMKRMSSIQPTFFVFLSGKTI